MTIVSFRWSALAALVLLLAGCAAEPATTASSSSPSAGGATSTPSTTSEPPSLADLDRISLSVAAFTLYAGETEVAALSTDDATIDTTVAALTEALGEPETETLEENDPAQCALANVTYSWGEALRIVDYTGDGAEESATIRLLAPTVPSVGGTDVRLEAAGGHAVGDDIAALIEDTPTTDKDGFEADGEYTNIVILERDDRVKDAFGGVWGLAAVADGSVITVIGAPIPVNSEVDC
jgi:molybdopterin converting factor small subunit